MLNAETPKVQLTMAGVMKGAKGLGPISLFTIPFGIAFGTAAIERGVTSDQSIVMSLSVFSAAAQFAALDFWEGPLPAISLLLTVLAVGTRLILMGATLAPWLNRLPRPKRLLALSVLSDVNFADSYSALRRDERDIGRLAGGGLALCTFWVIGTAIGVIAGANLGDLGRFGIDVVMVAFFTSIAVGQWEGLKDILPSIVAAAVAVLGLTLLPPGWNIVLAAVAGGIAGVLWHER
ncbi:AzlC family ABC transporter permease [Pelagibius sp. Alg239-R121]|uniref:AzlC family ABC transporter permease n=1 Tax=Pelagibius sp. Alg239-R121 TaxID=2993448 RepID=UPI0024A79370|nr:AzlC family ABC transporter permease [Pelagibius sp. Alg239-R121]